MTMYGIVDAYKNEIGPRYDELATARRKFDRMCEGGQDVYLVYWLSASTFSVMAH